MRYLPMLLAGAPLLAFGTPLRASPSESFSPADVQRHQAAIVGLPPRMASLPGEADRAAVEKSIAPRDSELITLRIAWLCQSPAIWAKHVEIAKTSAGLTTAEIARLTVGAAAPGWSEHDRAILKAAEELHEDAMVSEATWAALAKQFDRYQLVRLPLLIGHVQSGAYIENYLRIPLPKDSPGLYAR